MLRHARAKIVANAHLGRLNEARAELRRMLAIDPRLTITGYRMLRLRSSSSWSPACAWLAYRSGEPPCCPAILKVGYGSRAAVEPIRSSPARGGWNVFSL
jgi:hypothetical protein